VPAEGSPTRPLFPAGWRVALDPGLRRPRPRLLVGGSPLRILRVTDPGDRLVDALAAGGRVPASVAARRLVGRLVDAGMAEPRPTAAPGASASPVVGVVIPCHDRKEGLAVTLAAIDAAVAVTVVDDGSTDPAATEAVAAARPATTVIRRAGNGGPAMARNDGWRAIDAEIVAFVDTDCSAGPGWIAPLAAHFGDPAVAAVAPRVVAVPAPGAPRWLAAYERERGALDLGRAAAPVGPRSRVPYVPSTALLVRRHVLATVGGFDERLRTGEDVDLVWRLRRAGWQVRYDPSTVIGHPVRPGVGPWLRQRFDYGRSAAPLAARHGGAVAPLVAPAWSLAAWVLVGLRRPTAGLAVAAGAAARLVARQRRARAATAPPKDGRPDCDATRTRSAHDGHDGRGGGPEPLGVAMLLGLAVRGQLATGRGLAATVRRTWWPLALLALVRWRRVRPALAAAVVAPPLVAWHRRRPPLPLPVWWALCTADDLAYGAGVWAGAIAGRDLRCLLPDLS
jgi:mycofactocin system glycosyltransferase